MSNETECVVKKEKSIFVLNLRGINVDNGLDAREISSLLGGYITVSEMEKYDKFTTILRDTVFISNLDKDGWFKKTYKTARGYIERYLKSQPGNKIFYGLHSSKSNDSREKIAKFLYFCELMGRKVPKFELELSDEQQMIVEQRSGISVYNSGPGTGKTTTAVFKTASLLKEGVIVVSFTNAAVNNFHEKLYDVIDDVENMSVKPGKKIYLATIDSIAKLPCPTKEKTISKPDFQKIRKAAMRDIAIYQKLFADLQGNQIYKHIIIDEAQDVNDDLFEILIGIYVSCKFESMTVIGDPRQRLNTTAGGIFQSMLENGSEDKNTCQFSFENPYIVKSRITYRFENPNLLKLCNIISNTRPNIHVEMISGSIEKTNCKFLKIKGHENVVKKIMELLEDQKTVPGEIAIISPIVNKESTIKKEMDLICQSVTRNGINVSNEIKPECIYSSSIQSVKGLEFDYVFFVGSSNFPEYMLGTYGDVNDGMSMNFVANTRAKKQIFYVTDNSNALPMHVPEEMAEGEARTETVYQRKIIHSKAIKSEDVLHDEYERMETNMRTIFSVPRTEMENYSFTGSQNLQNFKYELISSILMNLGGKTIPMLIQKEIGRDPAEYNEAKKIGSVFDLKTTLDTRNFGYVFWNIDHKPAIAKIYNAYNYEDIEKHKIFKFVMTSKLSELHGMDDIANPVIKISRLLETMKGNYIFKQTIVQGCISASAIENDKVILIFTDSTHLSLMVKKKNPTKTVFMVSLMCGKIYKIGEPVYSLKRYEYQIKFIFSLFYHFKIMKRSDRKSVV